MSIFSICKHTFKESFESVYRASPYNVTVISPCLRQNERDKAFGRLVSRTNVNELQVCFVALVMLFITSRDGTTRQQTL